MKRLLDYRREALFAVVATCNWSSCYALLHNTARFHFHNWRRTNTGPSEVFTVDLRLGNGKTAAIKLRSLSGDIFILHEILTFAAYHISNSRIAHERVYTIIDGGANIGITSLYFAARYPHAKIYSVEPLPQNFTLLEANVKHETRIKPLYGCITGTSQKTVQFTTGHPTWGNCIGEVGITVPAFTVEELCRTEGINQVDLLKLDIEGAEEQVFANGNFLDRVQHIVIELHNDYDFRRFQKDIEAFGFEAHPPDPPDTRMITATKRASQAEL